MRLKNLKIFITNRIYSNPILYTFTKEYQKECKERQVLIKNKHLFELKSDVFDVEECVKRLKKSNFKSNFHM